MGVTAEGVEPGESRTPLFLAGVTEQLPRWPQTSQSFPRLSFYICQQGNCPQTLTSGLISCHFTLPTFYTELPRSSTIYLYSFKTRPKGPTTPPSDPPDPTWGPIPRTCCPSCDPLLPSQAPPATRAPMAPGPRLVHAASWMLGPHTGSSAHRELGAQGEREQPTPWGPPLGDCNALPLPLSLCAEAS